MDTVANRLLAEPDFAERHEIEIPAPPEVVWAAWKRSTAGGPPRVAKVLFAVRSLISWVRHGHGHRDLPKIFTPLAEEWPHEIVEGAVGRWWTLGAQNNRIDVAGLEEFLGFDEPGYAKATVSMRFERNADGGTRAITQTRVQCTDAEARRAMGRYWRVIRPFSGAIRVVMLRRLRKLALR